MTGNYMLDALLWIVLLAAVGQAAGVAIHRHINRRKP